MQSDYITDERSLAFFADSQHRIQTMATIHEQLYQSESLGEIHIELHQDNRQKIYLKIWDNGVGMSDKINWQESNSLGLKLVRIFAKQLKAEVEYDFSKGVSFSLIFEQLKYRSRF